MGFVNEGVITFGPWGGENGNTWSFRPSREITNIILREDGKNVVSIAFKDANGDSSGTFGGNNNSSTGIKERQIQIRSPSEYLESVRGTYGKGDSPVTLIMSLKFTTNFTTYGPFGNPNGGDSFSIPIVDSVVVGFFGSADSYLSALGIFVKPAPTQECISLGPWGGSGGGNYSFRVGSWITQITVRANENCIISISFKDANGDKYGAFGGGNQLDKSGEEHTVNFDGYWEYVKSIKGRYDKFLGLKVVTQLSIVTNMSTYGPFGNTSETIPASATRFSLPVEGSFVNGFHGKAGYYLDSIGIYCQQATPPGAQGAVKMGPWGGPGGDTWSYITNRGINQIVIYTGDNIKSISFRDSSGLSSATFGGNSPDNKGTRHTVKIDWPDEYLVSVKGTYGKLWDIMTITSLQFKTNRSTSRSFGKIDGNTPFSIPITQCATVGFHGRAGYFLDAIGIFVKPTI